MSEKEEEILEENLEGLKEDMERNKKEGDELFQKIKNKSLLKFIKAWCLAHSSTGTRERKRGKEVEWISPTELVEKLSVSYPTAEEYSKAVRCLEKYRNVEYLRNKFIRSAKRLGEVKSKKRALHRKNGE